MKYPKTSHVPWSENISDDDKIHKAMYFDDVVVTIKLDGECTGMTKDIIHARSLDSKDHPSRHWVKQLHNKIKHEIPDNWKIFGENLYAKHSIFYDSLESYFYVFHILENNIFLSWNDVRNYCQLLNLTLVPVIYEGKYNEELIKSLYPMKNEQEGYVIRNKSSFSYVEFNKNMAKFVRKNHIKTSSHWMREKMVVNQLTKS